MGLVMYSAAPSAYPMLLLSTMVSMTTGMPASSGSALRLDKDAPAVHIGHGDVERYHVGPQFTSPPQTFFAACGRRHLVAFFVQERRHQILNNGIVIDAPALNRPRAPARPGILWQASRSLHLRAAPASLAKRFAPRLAPEAAQ